MATKLFDLFPKISYTLDDEETNQVVTDIFKRIILSKEFQENNSYFDLYDIMDGETPEEISYRFYGTQDLHWLILMTNNIIDPRFEWPVSEAELIKRVESKYGTEKDVFTVNRAVNPAGYQIETYFILLQESTHKKPKRLILEGVDDGGINIPISYRDPIVGTEYQSNFEVEQTKNETYRRIKILKSSVVQDVLLSFNNIAST